MTHREIVLSLALIEGAHLADLFEEFVELLATGRDSDDPAIARLTPDVYPQDAVASAEFAESTRDDLLDRRVADATTVRRALEPFVRGVTEELSEDEALASRDVVIPDDELDTWLRALTALRLVIASRLGVTTDDDHDSNDPRFGVYDWLGYRLDNLIVSAETDHLD